MVLKCSINHMLSQSSMYKVRNFFVVAGQIRYTMYVASAAETPVTIVGPVSFNGSAQAGTS